MYPASGNPRMPAPIAAPLPMAPRGPVCRERSAAIVEAPPNPASSQLPTLMGEVGRKTRSMFKNREGRPRSSIKRAALTAAPPAAMRRVLRTSPPRSGDPDQVAAAPSAADAPATPPT